MPVPRGCFSSYSKMQPVAKLVTLMLCIKATSHKFKVPITLDLHHIVSPEGCQRR